MTSKNIDRRAFLRGMTTSMMGGALGAGSILSARQSVAQTSEADPRFLIVLCGAGGASIIDSFLAIRESESVNAPTINCFPDALVQQIDGSPFRALDLEGDGIGQVDFPYRTNQSSFVRKHHRDLMVTTLTQTSVNHAVAQKRSLTGNEAWRGRTLQEAVAQQYGRGYALPNVNMAAGTAYIEPGNDTSIDSRSFAEPVVAPARWPLSLHGSKGLAAPNAALIARARALRNERLESEAKFTRVFERSQRLRAWIDRRRQQGPLEGLDLITKLMLFSDSAQNPLSAHGLSESPDLAKIRQIFPGYEYDGMQAQAAMAFLLLKHRVSVTVTVGEGPYSTDEGGESEDGNVSLGFDFSHQAHRAGQAVSWDRLLKTADGLIELLKSEEYANGQSFWDRSLLYIATDFGRSKRRPANAPEFGSGHDLNNGVAILSPLVPGNTVLGGVDANTGLTYGFDLRTGAPNPGRHTSEPELYAGILQALGVDTSGAGLPDVLAMRRGA